MTYFFDRLYRLGAWGAAACMLLICTLVSLQVFLRLIDAIMVIFGAERLGFEISGVSEMAAFLLVGATFLSLAYTFTHHAHIRVTLVINRLPAAVRVWIESLALLIALGLSVLITHELVLLVGESLEYHDISSGLLALPLWIPQSVLVAGTGLLCLAILETLIATLRTAFTAPSSYVAPEPEDGAE